MYHVPYTIYHILYTIYHARMITNWISRRNLHGLEALKRFRFLGEWIARARPGPEKSTCHGVGSSGVSVGPAPAGCNIIISIVILLLLVWLLGPSHIVLVIFSVILSLSFSLSLLLSLLFICFSVHNLHYCYYYYYYCCYDYYCLFLLLLLLLLPVPLTSKSVYKALSGPW